MPTHRPERVSERIHQEISLMLYRQVSDPRLANVNVTRVEVSGDLRIAKVFVSPRGDDAQSKELIAALAHAAGYFRHQLALSLGLRYVPEIRFQVDHAVEKGERFLQVLEQVQAEGRAAQHPRRSRARK